MSDVTHVIQLTKPNSGRKKSASNLMENIFMNTVSKLIYLKNDIITYMNFIYVRDNYISFSSISVYFSYK